MSVYRHKKECILLKWLLLPVSISAFFFIISPSLPSQSRFYLVSLVKLIRSEFRIVTRNIRAFSCFNSMCIMSFPLDCMCYLLFFIFIWIHLILMRSVRIFFFVHSFKWFFIYRRHRDKKRYPKHFELTDIKMEKNTRKEYEPLKKTLNKNDSEKICAKRNIHVNRTLQMLIIWMPVDASVETKSWKLIRHYFVGEEREMRYAWSAWLFK